MYVDGFVLAVPTANKEAFRRTPARRPPCSRSAAPCRSSSAGAMTCPKARSIRLAKIMADPRLSPDRNPMPFVGKRMIFGGFEAIVDA